jgi:hypothetical protein
MTEEDRQALCEAAELLESPSFAARLANTLGQPVDRLLRMLPENATLTVQDTVKRALVKALDMAVGSLHRGRRHVSAQQYRWFTAAAGAGGGLLGWAGLAVELPVTTTIMLRSIADIAQSEGEDIDDPEVRLACLSVFALGGRSPQDEAAETAYFLVRAALAREVAEAARYLAGRGLAGEAAPALVRFITSIAARFGIVVSQKVAAQAIPLIGAAGGATVNAVFTDHFQKMARGHFTVRRLEREYGEEIVRAEYERCREELRRRAA